jgi:Tfp pilus assembly protein PilF
MSLAIWNRTLRTIAIGCAMAMVSPLAAETFEELDQLSDASAEEETGIQLAQEQAERGELLEALATLERVLASEPKAHDARLLQAYYLCKVDDIRGGKVALSKLKKKRYEDEDLNVVYAQCGVEQEG